RAEHAPRAARATRAEEARAAGPRGAGHAGSCAATARRARPQRRLRPAPRAIRSRSPYLQPRDVALERRHFHFVFVPGRATVAQLGVALEQGPCACSELRVRRT